jgi:hypothetical protein
MFKKIENPAAYEMRPVIHFLNARNTKPADIHCQLFEVSGEHAMNDSVVWRWVRHFNEGCKNLHDNPWSGRLGACSGEDSREQMIHHFVTFPAFSTNSMTTKRSKKKRGLHRRQHHSVMQDTKTGAPLRQVPRQWWKLCISNGIIHGLDISSCFFQQLIRTYFLDNLHKKQINCKQK